MFGQYPILEFDSSPEAILEPRKLIQSIDIPACAVVCFFQDVINTLVKEHKARIITHLKSEIGQHAVYELEYGGQRLAVFHPGVGALLAT